MPLIRVRYAAALLVAANVLTAAARQPNPVRPEEYGRWEQLAAQRTPLSPDGTWLVYGITRSSRDNELRFQPTTGGAPIVVAFGEQPVFADDSKWAACLVGMSEEDEAKLRKDKKPIRKKLALINLAAGTTTNIDGVESFSFSPAGTHIAIRRYAEGNREPGDNSEAVAPGTPLIVKQLATGQDATFGSVSEIAWQDKGPALAFAITIEGGVGNGLQLYDTNTGVLRTLDSSNKTYSGLSWRKESTSLAALRSADGNGREGPNHTLLVWSDVVSGTMKALEPSTLAADLRVVRFRSPQWSEDGAWVYVGVGPWAAKASADGVDRSRRVVATSTNPDELPDVQVWHPSDTIVMPRQKLDARRERERSMLAAWNVAEGRLVRIAQKIGEEASPIKRSGRALVIDTNAFAMDRSIGRVYGSAWTIDLASGQKTDVAQRIEDRLLQSSPGGKYLLYVKGDHYWTVDVASGKQTNVTATIASSFVDRESDDTGDSKPPFGVAGWTTGDQSVLLYDKLDIWEIKPDGTGATRLTNGAAGEIRHRVVRLDPDAEWIDRTQPIYVGLFGLRSKKNGYATMSLAAAPAAAAGPGGAVRSLLLLDKRVDRLAKAKRADRFVYASQDFDDSPDYFVGNGSLNGATQITTTNPFMREYAWGRTELIEYKNRQGVPLQATLTYPAGYTPGRKYPMVVYMYEKLSDGLHFFSAPSERDYYNAAAFSANGYFYLQPDIVFRPRDPGLSVVDAVGPAVQRVIAMGLVDANQIGSIGHSWGGFDSAFLATHTKIFKASVAGAAITDLVSNYGNHHWSSGIAETDHIETGQQRMQVPLYEDLQAYIRNSAIYTAHTMTTPLLLMTGDNDGTVHFHQSVALYNIARRAGRNVVMLTYGGEDHGLRKKQNQIDYHHRIFEWFGHHLKGEAAPRWITDGERYIDRERDLQQRKLPAKPAPATTSPQVQP